MAARLLVVDDDEFLLSLIARVLEQCGYAVDSAADGLAAWAMPDSEPRRFDLLLLDKHMPRMDGISLLKRLKSDQCFPDVSEANEKPPPRHSRAGGNP